MEATHCWVWHELSPREGEAAELLSCCHQHMAAGALSDCFYCIVVVFHRATLDSKGCSVGLFWGQAASLVKVKLIKRPNDPFQNNSFISTVLKVSLMWSLLRFVVPDFMKTLGIKGLVNNFCQIHYFVWCRNKTSKALIECINTLFQVKTTSSFLTRSGWFLAS